MENVRSGGRRRGFKPPKFLPLPLTKASVGEKSKGENAPVELANKVRNTGCRKDREEIGRGNRKSGFVPLKLMKVALNDRTNNSCWNSQRREAEMHDDEGNVNKDALHQEASTGYLTDILMSQPERIIPSTSAETSKQPLSILSLETDTNFQRTSDPKLPFIIVGGASHSYPVIYLFFTENQLLPAVSESNSKYVCLVAICGPVPSQKNSNSALSFERNVAVVYSHTLRAEIGKKEVPLVTEGAIWFKAITGTKNCSERNGIVIGRGGRSLAMASCFPPDSWHGPNTDEIQNCVWIHHLPEPSGMSNSQRGLLTKIQCSAKILCLAVMKNHGRGCPMLLAGGDKGALFAITLDKEWRKPLSVRSLPAASSDSLSGLVYLPDSASSTNLTHSSLYLGFSASGTCAVWDVIQGTLILCLSLPLPLYGPQPQIKTGSLPILLSATPLIQRTEPGALTGTERSLRLLLCYCLEPGQPATWLPVDLRFLEASLPSMALGQQVGAETAAALDSRLRAMSCVQEWCLGGTEDGAVLLWKWTNNQDRPLRGLKVLGTRKPWGPEGVMGVTAVAAMDDSVAYFAVGDEGGNVLLFSCPDG